MDSEEASFKETDLKFFFVVQNDTADMENVPKYMRTAYANIREYIKEEKAVEWVQESECLTIDRDSLTKRHIFVLNEFVGDVFNYLQSSKSLIIGPRCLVTCLMENVCIPLGKSPVFNIAMRNLIVCASGFPVPEKIKLKKLVSWMGGYYVEDLFPDCTQLVSNTVQSEKYEKAGLEGIPIVHSDWVYTVWEVSKTQTISADGPIMDKFKLPIFYNLTITSSGITTERKDNLMKVIIENGGKYLKTFKSREIDILIVDKDHTCSDKYRAAIKCKKLCLLPDWIFDSIKKGYAISTEHYKVSQVLNSTPTKTDKCMSATDFNPDGTQISEISYADLPRSSLTVNETISSLAVSVASSIKSLDLNKPKEKTYKSILEGIEPLQAKKAGLFLDGCCIYLTGFNTEEKDKLNKILNVGGATRFDEISEKLTHIIVGEYIPNEFAIFKEKTISASLVTIEWITESIKIHQPANEEKFLFRAKLPMRIEPEAPSPSSKKTLHSMNQSFKKPMAPRKRLNFAQEQTKPSNGDEELDLLQQYNNNENQKPLGVGDTTKKMPAAQISQLPQQSGTETLDTSIDNYEDLDFLDGLTVYVHEHQDDDLNVTQVIIDAGGKLVSNEYRNEVDYVIVPSETCIDVNAIPVKGKHIVTNLWLDEATQENKLQEIKYYHAPIPLNAERKPLEGMTIVISLYSNHEKVFLEYLTVILGAKLQSEYAKKQYPLLICESPRGEKYKAAIKWDFPAVTSEWLVECAKEGVRVNLEPYIVGNATLNNLCNIFSNCPSASGINDKRVQSNSAVDNNANKSQISENTPKHSKSLRHRRLSELSEKLPQKSSSSESCHKQSLRTLEHTPEHRRLQNLRESETAIDSPSSLTTTPEMQPFNISDYVKDVSTPVRETLYNVLKEARSKETPQSQRIKKLVATPGTRQTPPTPKFPEFCTTPEVEKRRFAWGDKFYLPIDRKKIRRQSTPLSELKRRMWKETLGDEYEDTFNTQFNTQTQVQLENDSEMFSTTEDEQDPSYPSSNFKRLNDFIKNRDEKKDFQAVEETEDIPQQIDSEMICGTAEEMVGWRDPSEVIPAKRLKTKGMRYKGVPYFLISCTVDKRKNIIKQINDLKGRVSDSVNYDENCTHLIFEKPNRGEKLLSGIAAGKWILSLKYIEDSVNAGHFLDEEDYEYGNPKAAANLPILKGTEQSIASSAFKWRTKISKNEAKSSGAFTGFRVLLHLSKKEIFQRVIKAGGGEVIDIKPPFAKCKEVLQATHCFLDPKETQFQLSPADRKTLVDGGVFVLSYNYLNCYLTSEIEPDHSKYLLSL